MDAKVTWNNKMSFTGLSESGFTVPLDSRVEEGGEGKGMKPMELICHRVSWLYFHGRDLHS